MLKFDDQTARMIDLIHKVKLTRLRSFFSKKITYAHLVVLFETSSTHLTVCSLDVPVSRNQHFKVDDKSAISACVGGTGAYVTGKDAQEKTDIYLR